MNDTDMIMEKSDNITYGGYTIDSNFLNNDIPITYTINNENLFGGKSLPAGLAFFNTETIPETPETSETIENIQMGELIDSSTFDKFIDKFSSNDSEIKNIEKDIENIENVIVSDNEEKLNIHEKKSRKITPVRKIKTHKNARKKFSKSIPKITFKKTRTKY